MTVQARWRGVLIPSRWFRSKGYWLRRLRDDSATLVSQLREAESSHQRALAEIRGALQTRLNAIQTQAQGELARARENYQKQLRSATDTLREVDTKCGRWAAPWDGPDWKRFPDSRTPIPKLSRVGTLKLEGESTPLIFPALVPVIGGRNVVFEGPASALAPAIGAANSLGLRLLCSLPPGKLRLLLIDPASLGKHVAGFLHLVDYSAQLVTQGAWYQQRDIEERLEELSDHIATVTQRLLRTRYQTIEEFNVDAGEVSEPYRLLVVINFPRNFTERSALQLASIFSNGPRCGVLSVIVIDASTPMPYGFDLGRLKQHSTLFSSRGDAFAWCDSDFEDVALQLDGPPAAQSFESLVRSVGQAAKQVETVKIPFDSIAIPQSEWWKGTTRDGLQAAIGRTGARDVLSLGLGKDLAQNVLIAGRPGSGKSTLLHVLIANLVTAYPPDELNLYLVDFKEGVEFKQYAGSRLPHVRVVAIHSEREFGLSVLRELHNELQRRGAAYRRAGGGQTVAEYRGKTGAKLARILLVVDEFQKFLIEDDRIAADATQLLDILIRQGRAFGIHVLLSSQTLAGAFSLPKSTLDLVTIRIALQCSEADSRVILGTDNPAAAQLSRPGEGVYNGANGAVASNVPFQVAWLGERERSEHLRHIAELSWTGRRSVSVFDGDEPVRLENNGQIRDILAAPDFPAPSTSQQAWLGEPVTIKPPTAARFLPQEGRHLIVVGRDEDAAAGLIVSALVGVALQHRPGEARFVVADLSAEGSTWNRSVSALSGIAPGRFQVQRQRKIASLLSSAVEGLGPSDGSANSSRAILYLVVFGLHRVQDLDASSHSYSKPDSIDDPHATAEEHLLRVLRLGPEAGVRVICWSDTVGAMKRCLGRQGSAEFGMRVALPMQDHESEELLGNPAASRLRSGRALFFDDLLPNELEKFRPYEIPSESWIAGIAQRVKEKTG